MWKKDIWDGECIRRTMITIIIYYYNIKINLIIVCDCYIINGL